MKVLKKKCLRHSMNRMQSQDDRIGTFEINIISLSYFDDKIYIQNNGYDISDMRPARIGTCLIIVTSCDYDITEDIQKRSRRNRYCSKSIQLLSIQIYSSRECVFFIFCFSFMKKLYFFCYHQKILTNLVQDFRRSCILSLPHFIKFLGFLKIQMSRSFSFYAISWILNFSFAITSVFY